MNIDIKKVDEPIKYTYLFNEDNFYLCSKRPYSLNNAKRVKILESSYLVQVDNELIGIVSIRKRKIDYYVIINIAYSNEEYYEEEKGKYVLNVIFTYLSEHEKFNNVYLYVENYDERLMELCKLCSLNKIGEFKDNVYKNGRYYNSSMFMIKKG